MNTDTEHSGYAQIFRAAEYREISRRVDLGDLFSSDSTHYIACDPYMLPIEKPVVFSDSLKYPKMLSEMHMPEMHIAKINNALVCKGQIIINSDMQTLLIDSFRRHARINNDLISLDDNLYASREELIPSTYLHGRYFYLDGRHGGHFGHFLTEVLPRLWASSFIDLSNIKILMFRIFLKSWTIPYLHALGIKDSQIVLFKKPVRCEELLIARQACVLSRYFHPLVQDMCRKISNFFGKGYGPERIYISRRDIPQRSLVNEKEIESLAENAGYTSIQPEKMPIDEQVRLFAGAKDIISPIGSNTYNSLFCEYPTQKLILRPSTFATPVDLTINTALGGALAYVDGHQVDVRENPMTGSWYLDPKIFKSALDWWASS